MGQPVAIDQIKGTTVFLKKGPVAGTNVVVVGTDELYGAETGVQGEEK